MTTARLACLRYACAVSHTLEIEGRRAPRLKGLRVPTRGGWSEGSRAMFGPGWPSEHSSVDDTLTRFLERVRGLSSVLTQTEQRLLLRPDELCGDTLPVEAVRRFLERHGVAHGLRPGHEVFRTEVRGEALNRPPVSGPRAGRICCPSGVAPGRPGRPHTAGRGRGPDGDHHHAPARW
ncbi:hypothetical protein GCM10009654_15590 [Streptomyces hebeiensis]|uniref:Uncharacterized protein n=1 Tax=Streptomyces hebeiensis TaxID=229486 RepID=A0ABN1UND3_9ACTN